MKRLTAVFVSAVFIAAAGLVGEASAKRPVGVATAANPHVFGKLPEAGTRTIVIGKKIIFNERIRTTATGLLQILLLDGSTFTVGPASELVIDRFVYDPDKKIGELVTTFAKGTMRFIGGKLSKQKKGVKIHAHPAVLGVRGGIVNLRHDPAKGAGRFSLVFGDELTLKRPGCRLERVYEPGYMIITRDRGTGCPAVEIRKTTSRDAALFQRALAGSPGTDGGTPQAPTNADVVSSGIDEYASANSPGDNPATTRPDTVESTKPEEIETVLIENDEVGTLEVLAGIGTLTSRRVLSFGNTYNAFVTSVPTVIIDPGDNGIVGGTATSDQIATFNINGAQSVGQLAQGDITLPEVSTPGTTAVANATSPFGLLSGDVFVGTNADFMFYRLFANGDPTRPVYVLGGTPSPEADLIGNGELRRYSLSADPIENITIPFAQTSGVGTPSANAVITDLLFLEPNGARFDDDSNAVTTGSPVFLQTSIEINGSGAAQQSSVTVFTGLGAALTDTNFPIFRRGSARTVTTNLATGFTGHVGLVTGPNNGQFYGPNGQNFLLSSEFDNNGSVFLDIPADPGASTKADNAFSTVHVADLVSEGPVGAAQSARTLTGYIGGFGEASSPLTGAATPPVIYRNLNSKLTVEFDTAINELGARFVVEDLHARDPEVQSYALNVGFEVGNVGNFGHSAFIDDDRYAAVGSMDSSLTRLTTDGATVINHQSATVPASYFISGDLVNGLLPDGVTGGPCTCAFLEWGYWGATLEFSDASLATGSRTDFFHLGTWVAGDISNASDIPTTGTASFNGRVVANVATVSGGTQLRQYLTTGNMALNWDFSARSGTMSVSNFDPAAGGLSFSGTMNANNTGAVPNQFNGGLSGAGLVGGAIGSFVRGPSTAADGAIGHFDVTGTVGGDAYDAVGSFAVAQ